MPKILDLNGSPIESAALKEPQTSKIAQLKNQYLDSYMRGMSPDKLAGALRAADNGDLYMQHRIFADMEERDPHLYAETSKRKMALLKINWHIEPPRNPSAKEKADAEWLTEMLTDSIDPLEDLMLAAMDGVGHGFAPIEMVWGKQDQYLLPRYYPRPQEWFQLNRERTELRLRDSTGDGAPLTPFGWVMHTHGKAKTGYAARMGLYRVCVWPFVYKAYALSDFAEFLETFGLPIITGKYFSGATDEEKATLMRAVTALGHSARAIMPVDMQLEIAKITGSGEGTPHLTMMTYSDAALSKAILGQTLSATAQSTGLGSGVADLQGEVRDDILRADAREIAGTITRDILYPMLALNRGVDNLARCARFVFDFEEAVDFKMYAEGIPKLVETGVSTIPVSWVHKRCGIPMPEEGEATLQPKASQPTTEPAPVSAKTAALSAEIPAAPQPWAVLAADQLAGVAQPAINAMLAQITAMLDKAESLDEFGQMLLAAYPDLASKDMTDVLSQALAAASLQGALDVKTGSGA